MNKQVQSQGSMQTAETQTSSQGPMQTAETQPIFLSYENKFPILDVVVSPAYHTMANRDRISALKYMWTHTRFLQIRFHSTSHEQLLAEADQHAYTLYNHDPSTPSTITYTNTEKKVR